MAWTYTDDPGSVPRDAVRFALGDTDPTDQLCSDAQVTYALAETGSVAKLAAALLADRLAARAAREESVSIDGVSLSGAGKAASYRLLATSLRSEVAKSAVPAPVVAGALARTGALVLTGVRASDMALADLDTDRPRSIFRLTSPTGEDDTVIL